MDIPSTYQTRKIYGKFWQEDRLSLIWRAKRIFGMVANRNLYNTVAISGDHESKKVYTFNKP